MKPIRVLLVDDHELVRAGFRVLLESVPGITVVAEAGDGRQALAAAAANRPTLVFMDIALPVLNGLEVTARIKQEFPDVQVIILSLYANHEYVAQALRSGATGYLLKNSRQAELEVAIDAVLHGQTYLSPAVSQHAGTGPGRPTEALPAALDRLTPRQCQILQLIAEGKSTKEVAQSLGLSVKTAEMHRTHLMQRLNLHDVTGLVRFAIRVGLVSPHD